MTGADDTTPAERHDPYCPGCDLCNRDFTGPLLDAGPGGTTPAGRVWISTADEHDSTDESGYWKAPDDTTPAEACDVIVSFVVAESAINVLDGVAVCATTRDGVQAVGILTPFVPQDGTRTMVQIREVVSDELVLATDIRNFAEIVVP